MKNLKMWYLLPVLVFFTLVLNETLRPAAGNSGLSGHKSLSQTHDEITYACQRHPATRFNGCDLPSTLSASLLPLGSGKVVTSGWIFY